MIVGNPNYEVTELPGTLTIRAKQAEPTAAPTAAQTEPPAHTAHHFVITDVTITRIRYRCDGCGISLWKDNVSSRNAIPGLMKDEEGEDIDYTAGVTREDGKRILTVTPELEENDVRGICLRLKYELLKIERFRRFPEQYLSHDPAAHACDHESLRLSDAISIQPVREP